MGNRGRRLPGPSGELSGRVRVPGSKSITNRGLIAAAVAGGGVLHTPLDGDDTRRLARSLDRAGWSVTWEEELRVGERRLPSDPPVLDLGDSGTGARFMIALCASVQGRARVDGSARLRERPFSPLLATLRGLGASLTSREDGLPVDLDGRQLAGGRIVIRPGPSSQFVSALLLTGPLMRRALELEVVGPLPSAPYLDLTEAVLRTFGAEVESSPDRRSWRVGCRPLSPETALAVEGDWSAAAFPLAAVAVAGGRVEIGPLDPSSAQPDRCVVDLLVDAGVSIFSDGPWIVAEGAAQRPVHADVEQSPDLFPALAVVAASGPPGSSLRGLSNLRFKESDRLTAMITNVRRLGAELDVSDDVVKVVRPMRRGGRDVVDVTAADDHRIAMAMAVAALVAGPLRLDRPSCVDKSFPGFWDEWRAVVGEPR